MPGLLLALLLVGCGDDAPPAAVAEEAAAAPVVIPVSSGHTSTEAAAPRTGPSVLPAQVSRSGGWAHFGSSFTVDPSATLTCEQLLADPAAQVDRTVRVTGRVADVCQSQGCWMVLTPKQATSADQVIRVTMRDHAFSVDKQGAGRETELEGILVQKEIDPDTVAHYESEAGDATAVPERQGMAYELVASVVRIRNP